MHGKMGKMNKKGYLPVEMLDEFREFSDTLQRYDEGGQTEQTKDEFVTRTVGRLAEVLIPVSQNQTVSRIVESFIVAASPANLRTLFVTAVTDLSVVFLDAFASHVFERLVQKLPLFFTSSEHRSTDDVDSDVPQQKVVESFEAVCEFVDSQCDILVTHVYGSHVLRALLEALSGVPVAHELKKSQKSGHGRHTPAVSAKGELSQAKTLSAHETEKFRTLFDNYAKRIFHICDYEVHLKDPFFSLILQATLLILHKIDIDTCHRHCQTIVQRVVKANPQSEDPTKNIVDVAQTPAGSHLLEVMFRVSSDELMSNIFESMLQGNLLPYAIHPVANYVLQKFISSLKDKELMGKVYEELSKNLEDVLAIGYFGIVTSLAEGCRRLHVKQDELVTVLMEAFHCKEPTERESSLIRLVISFTTYEVFFSLQDGEVLSAESKEAARIKAPINIHGSLLLQEMLQFQKPKHAALGMVDLKPEEVQLLCCDPCGSHVVDVFFSSPHILEKNRDKFLGKLKGILVEIACSKNGSRCLESIWKNLKKEQRTLLAKELADSPRVRNDRFGQFVYRNFNLGLFASQRQRWLEQQRAQTSRKRAIKELVHSMEASKKKKKEDSGRPTSSNQQKKEEVEDSVTAMFVRHKRQHQSQAGEQGEMLDVNQRLLSVCNEGDRQTSPDISKKKKKTIRSSETVETCPVESSVLEDSEIRTEDEEISPKKKKKKNSLKKEKSSVVKKSSHSEEQDNDSEDNDESVGKTSKMNSKDDRKVKKEKKKKKQAMAESIDEA